VALAHEDLVQVLGAGSVYTWVEHRLDWQQTRLPALDAAAACWHDQASTMADLARTIETVAGQAVECWHGEAAAVEFQRALAMLWGTASRMGELSAQMAAWVEDSAQHARNAAARFQQEAVPLRPPDLAPQPYTGGHPGPTPRPSDYAAWEVFRGLNHAWALEAASSAPTDLTVEFPLAALHPAGAGESSGAGPRPATGLAGHRSPGMAAASRGHANADGFTQLRTATASATPLPGAASTGAPTGPPPTGTGAPPRPGAGFATGAAPSPFAYGIVPQTHLAGVGLADAVGTAQPDQGGGRPVQTSTGVADEPGSRGGSPDAGTARVGGQYGEGIGSPRAQPGEPNAGPRTASSYGDRAGGLLPPGGSHGSGANERCRQYWLPEDPDIWDTPATVPPVILG
jgi:hypothetical protein